MTQHPYLNLSPSAFWRKSVADPEAAAVDPVGRAKFTVSQTDKVATAGSCFAQHISRHLSQSGFNYLVTETAHPLVPDALAGRFGYGTFTARYANIYTSRQMTQLIARAYGEFQPADDFWMRDDGSIVDPFRPQIQPGGFATLEEFYADRAQHFAAVREAIETLDCLVFTLGLTECWRSRQDGAVYPVCPGVSGGRFEADRYEYHNLGFNAVLSDLSQIMGQLSEKNPSARVILTVSPVPLAATASGEHVLTATTFSKSVLRAAAGEFAAARDNVAYFPSYEIITGSFSRGSYFASDLRSVTEAGVAHVMRLFLAHYGAVAKENHSVHWDTGRKVTGDLSDVVRVVCEEEALKGFDVLQTSL